MKTLFKKIFILIGLLFFCFAPAATAEQRIITGAQSKISLKMEPGYPKPHENVHFVLESFSTDLNMATVQWFVDGKPVKSGKALLEFDVTVGGLGSKTEVRAAVASTNIGSLPVTVTLQPAQVDLIWQSHSYTPAFYRGKAYLTQKSGALIVAMPSFITTSGVLLDPQDLIYTWTVDTVVKGDKSGRWKNTFRVDDVSIVRGDKMVQVLVKAPSTALAASQTIIVAMEMPILAFYEHDPLEGIKYNRALKGTYKLVNEEVTIEAVPYFFSTPYKETAELSYGWNLNGKAIETQETKHGAVTLRQTGESGYATLNLNVHHVRNPLEAVFGKLVLEFGGTNNIAFPSAP